MDRSRVDATRAIPRLCARGDERVSFVPLARRVRRSRPTPRRRALPRARATGSDPRARASPREAPTATDRPTRPTGCVVVDGMDTFSSRDRSLGGGGQRYFIAGGRSVVIGES